MSSSDSSANLNVASMLGRTVVELGLATTDEVLDCEQLSAESDLGATSLGELLISNQVLTRRQLNRVKQVVDQKRTDQQIPGYKLLERLGAGAMATVFKARQLSLDRKVAIKILPRKFTTDPQFVERFYAEGRAAAKLNHPNIVQAFDVGQAGEHHYFVMEYVQGETVYDQLQQLGVYEEAEALRIVIAIADALNHVHEKGMMHRDVKPKNIMITPQGVPKLADMGLARQVSDAEAAQAEAGKAYGTPYYISPEQIRGIADVDFRADIYGLGATFYHMVTGQVPFDAPNPSAVMHKHLKEEITPPDHINDNLSSGVCEIIEVMMAKDREKRYASTADLLADLRSVAEGKAPVQAREKFDALHLAELGGGDEAAVPVRGNASSSLTEHPMFIMAMISIVFNVILGLILLLLLVFTRTG